LQKKVKRWRARLGPFDPDLSLDPAGFGGIGCLQPVK
jgi:hypothetical protein